MPEEYKGMTVPISVDLADGPKAFREYTDSLPNGDAFEEALANVQATVQFRVFTDAAALQAWAAPLGARANLVVPQVSYNVVVPYTRSPGLALAPTWFPHLTGVYSTGSGGSSGGRVNFVVPWPIDPPDTGGNLMWVMLSASNGVAVRLDPNEFDAQGFRWQVVTVGQSVPVLSWQVGISQSFD